MIRPLTIAAFVLACTSGLYLYQSKHEVQMTDQQIEEIVRQTAALREQSRNLATEWTMLNDPERLREFSDMYLHLKSIDPKQFTSLAELDGRLPPAEQPAAPAAASPRGGMDPDEAGPTASAGTTADDAAAADVAAESVPTPPTVPPVPVVALSVMRPLERKPVARPSVVEVEPARPAPLPPPQAREARPAYAGGLRRAEAHGTRTNEAVIRAQRPLPVAALPRPAVPGPRTAPQPVPAFPSRLSGPPRYVPQPVAQARLAAAPMAARPLTPPRPFPQPAQPATAPYGGSLLGMAHGAAPPAPLPTPVTYNAN